MPAIEIWSSKAESSRENVSTDGGMRNQIIDGMHALDVVNVMSCRGVDYDSEQSLVKIRNRQKIMKNKR